MSKSIVMLKNVRLAFPVLKEAERFDPSNLKQEARYSANLLFSKENDALYKQCTAAMLAAAEAKWPGKGAAAVKQLSAGLKVALADGDLKADKYDGFDGTWSISAHAKESTPPRLLDRDKTELPRTTSKIYAGCYVNASIEFWAQDNQFGKRINAQLRGVQFAADGDAFGGARAAGADEFDVVEGVDEVAGDDDFA